MVKSAREMQDLIERELASVGDGERRAVLMGLLVPPVPMRFGWDYGRPGDRLDCWLAGRSSDGEVLILYCEGGFGPDYPWGFISRIDDSLGMDSQWHVRLGDAAIGAGLLAAPPGYEVP